MNPMTQPEPEHQGGDGADYSWICFSFGLSALASLSRRYIVLLGHAFKSIPLLLHIAFGLHFPYPLLIYRDTNQKKNHLWLP